QAGHHAEGRAGEGRSRESAPAGRARRACDPAFRLAARPPRRRRRRRRRRERARGLMARGPVTALGAMMLALAAPASAALTPSEDVILKQLVTSAQTTNVSHVRAL